MIVVLYFFAISHMFSPSHKISPDMWRHENNCTVSGNDHRNVCWTLRIWTTSTSSKGNVYAPCSNMCVMWIINLIIHSKCILCELCDTVVCKVLFLASMCSLLRSFVLTIPPSLSLFLFLYNGIAPRLLLWHFYTAEVILSLLNIKKN